MNFAPAEYAYYMWKKIGVCSIDQIKNRLTKQRSLRKWPPRVPRSITAGVFVALGRICSRLKQTNFQSVIKEQQIALS